MAEASVDLTAQLVASLRDDPERLLAAIDVAVARIISGQAPMRIPAEPWADPDLVLSKCGMLIRALLSEIDQWKTWGVIEIAVRNPNVASFVDEWTARAEKAEAKLANR